MQGKDANMITSRRPGWVYVAQEDGRPLVKIGSTRCPRPHQRVHALSGEYHVPMSLRCATWIPLAAPTMERLLHGHFASARIEGEWFYLSLMQAELDTLVRNLTPVLVQCLTTSGSPVSSHRCPFCPKCPAKPMARTLGVTLDYLCGMDVECDSVGKTAG